MDIPRQGESSELIPFPQILTSGTGIPCRLSGGPLDPGKDDPRAPKIQTC